MEYDTETIIRRIEQLTEYMWESASDYGLYFQKSIKTVFDRADSAEYLFCKSIPVMEIKCSREYDDIHNKYFCNRAVAYFNSHLKDTRFYAKWEYIKYHFTYRILVVCD